MRYDVIGGQYEDDQEEVKFYTIGDLVELAQQYHDYEFVFLGDDEYTVGDLMSWRGSYDLPAIDYQRRSAKKGGEIANELSSALCDVHIGYKGGEYKYHRNDTFYVSDYGRSEEYRVCGFREYEDKIVLLTKLDPY